MFVPYLELGRHFFPILHEVKELLAMKNNRVTFWLKNKGILRQTEKVQKWSNFDPNQIFKEFVPPDFSSFHFRSKDLCLSPIFRENQDEPKICPKGAKMIQVSPKSGISEKMTFYF